jgi:uncharacterized Tic20 family protein
MDAVTDSSSTSPSRPPPGWYRKRGAVRWWDGNAWGPEAAPTDTASVATNPFEGGRPAAVVCHLSFAVPFVVFPLIVRYTIGRTNAFIRHHSAEAANFQLTCYAVWLTCFIVGIVGEGFTTTATVDDEPSYIVISTWFLLSIGAVCASFLLFACLALFGAVRAGQGRLWRYPVNFRLFPGVRPRRSDQVMRGE